MTERKVDNINLENYTITINNTVEKCIEANGK